MARLLILYSSRYGQTEKIARRIAARLEARGHSVEAVAAGRASRDPNPSDYDAVIVGAPIYVGRFPGAVGTWVRRWQPALAKRPTAFFAVSATAASPDPAGRARAIDVAERFLTRLGWRPALTASFAGAVPYTRYGLFTRIVMRWVVGRAGGDTDTSRDFEYTDWSEVERFADDVAARLLASGHAPASRLEG